ncbi:MAG: beta-N-acetylhexosaminidase, partial [Nitrospinota bacterium]|nr:beta-N-acetylhexosaminidase [Nitrospinota bacterium]
MTLSDWTPEEIAGQHLMLGFSGTEASLSTLERIYEGRVGGVILFERNIENAEQTLLLTHSLQRVAAQSPRGVPLLIAIDEEGGRVSRLSDDFTRFPPAAALGRIGDRDLVREAARVTGVELRCVGINMDMAPVLDLLTNPNCTVIGDRAYGKDPAFVGGMGAAAIAGLQAGGVAAVAKHFPGIGDMAPDPHETLPVSDLTLETLKTREFTPFRQAVNPSPPNGAAAGIMTAHAVFSKIDPECPASLSSKFSRDLLRGEVCHRGLVITDDLDMGAIADPVEGALSAVLAGADIAFICHSEEAGERAWARIAEAVRGEILSPGAESQSLGRILAAKAKFAEPARNFLEKNHLARVQDRRKTLV